MPLSDQTGTPRHFHSSTTSGSACLIRPRIRASISPLQSPSSSILASIRREGDSSVVVVLFFMPVGPRSVVLLCRQDTSAAGAGLALPGQLRELDKVAASVV